jgi:hypothetical protein
VAKRSRVEREQAQLGRWGGPEHACRGYQAAVARPGGRSGRSHDGQQNLASSVRLQAARERLARGREREDLDGRGPQLDDICLSLASDLSWSRFGSTTKLPLLGTVVGFFT